MYLLAFPTSCYHTLAAKPVPQNVVTVTSFLTPSSSLFSITHTAEGYAGQSVILTVLLNESQQNKYSTLLTDFF
jgi:hypothetical protein